MSAEKLKVDEYLDKPLDPSALMRRAQLESYWCPHCQIRFFSEHYISECPWCHHNDGRR